MYNGDNKRTGKVLDLDINKFYSLINSDIPILVDFWAKWCIPCKAVEPIIRNLARKYSGKMIFGRINVDQNSDLAKIYDIMSIPTLIIFHKGKEISRLVGALPKHIIELEIRKVLQLVGQL